MASGGEDSDAVVHECQVKCSSRKHSSNLTAALTKLSLPDEKVAAYLKWCCVRYSKALDSDGRNLVHLAASLGRLKLLNYLLKHKDVNINEKDKESHYTALHRSLFYGQIHCAVRLIEQGANMQQLDLDDLTPLDHVMMDRPELLEYGAHLPCEVYVWGTNTNYTLGTGNHQSRSNPEPLDIFRRQGISIKQAVMSKFHSAFMSSDGQLWTCGHGQGGRLGLEDELTILTPKSVKLPSKFECKQVDLGTDHTIVLMTNHIVMSFGLNSYHQLGLSPPPKKVLSPKPITALKEVKIIGIKAAKYHSVFWSRKELYTCGLNGGQLGHIKGTESTISTPRLVNLRCGYSSIVAVATSDGATVVANSRGEVFLLYEYEFKKIVKKNSRIRPVKVCVVGGHLDHNLKIGSLQKKGGDELKILIITSCSTIYMWQENSGAALRCELSLNRKILISDIVLNKNFLLLTSEDGEAFQGEIKVKKRKVLPEIEMLGSHKRANEDSQREEYDYIKLKRIPHIHRAVSITCDPKGRNFAVTQVHPKAGLLLIPDIISANMKENMKNLYDTIGQYDNLHDVTFEVEGHSFSAHRYIVAHASPVLEVMMKKHDKNGSCVLKLDNIKAVIFRRILCYMYTGDCDFLHYGACPVKIDLGTKENQVPDLISVVPEDLIDEEMISAFQLSNMKRTSLIAKRKALKIKDKENPLKLLKAAAKRFDLPDLEQKLETVWYDDGYIYERKEKRSFSDIKFSRKNLEYLWDVSLKSEDGMIIHAHKCILVSRLEYFDCMINQEWLESTQKTAIYLPIPGKVLQILINFLYTDEAPEVVNSMDFDLLARTLIIADQFFCSKLKELSEIALANLISLKNVVEILQMAEMYNADQLKHCSMEFIGLNLPAILESRSLEKLCDSLLEDLSEFYRSRLECMDHRLITTYYNAPDDELVDMISKTEPVSLDFVMPDTPPKPTSSKTPKKKNREKRNSQSGRTRNSSIWSITSEDKPEPLSVIDFCDDVDKEEEAWMKVVNHPPKQSKKAAKVCFPVHQEKLILQPIQEEKFILFSIPPVKERKDNILKEKVKQLEKDIQLLSTNSDRDFPALNSSSTERTHIEHVQGPRQTQEVIKKFVKVSQKDTERLAVRSISKNEETPKKPEVTVKSPWGVLKSESLTLTDIMKEERRANATGQNSVLASSPAWQYTEKPGSSLSEVMASEKREREQFARMISKPLKYTQMEDKAMEDLLALYKANDVTDERITIRRADYEFVSPPSWVSGRR